MSIFGYDPLSLYNGRGAFEAMGSGLSMDKGEIAFKSNFAFMDVDTKIVKRRRCDREFPSWGKPLIDEAIDGMAIPGYPDHKVSCKWATEHRCAIKISGPNLDSEITGNDPLKDNLKVVTCEAEDPDNKNAVFTAGLVNTLTETITEELLAHPINIRRK